MTVPIPFPPLSATRSQVGAGLLSYLIVGAFFGLVMTKSEAASWYRMQEMFRFQSFHMFGIIGSAILTGMLSTWALRRLGVRTVSGEAIRIPLKPSGLARYVFGGVIFGVGWGLASVCPAQMFTLLGTSPLAIGVPFLFALLGTWLYGALQSRLPH